jgi:acyl dehydratase
MPLNLDAVGTVGEPAERSWTSKDALLYALAVGAGYPDPLAELAFTTENSREVTQQVLPTFAVLLGAGAGGVMRSVGPFDRAMLVHAEQGVELHRPVPPEGTVTVTGRLADIVDKRSGALVVTESHAVDTATGDPAFTTRSAMFIRGEGGFAAAGTAGASGGDGARRSSADVPAVPWPPERPPDHRVTYTTLPHQALLYRLCGDRNPLHSDPAFAARAGFERPILHGLCTYGFTGRALLHALCGGDPARLGSMSGRFTRPVLPGATLTVDIWVDGEGEGGAGFRTTTEDGTTVLDRGRCTYR